MKEIEEIEADKGDETRMNEIESLMLELDFLNFSFCVNVGKKGQDFIDFGKLISRICSKGYYVESYDCTEDDENLCIKVNLIKNIIVKEKDEDVV